MVLEGLNKDVLERITKSLGIQTLKDKLPLDLVPNIQPVLISNPDPHVNVVEHTDTTGVLFSCPTDRDFFLTSASITATVLDGNSGTNTLSIVLESGATVLLAVDAISGSLTVEGTQGNNALSQVYIPPIKLLRGSLIDASMTTDTGQFSITGYTQDSL